VCNISFGEEVLNKEFRFSIFHDVSGAGFETSWLHFSILNDGFSKNTKNNNNNIECNTPSLNHLELF
jgi:Gpi18-like mannosyltransferase